MRGGTGVLAVTLATVLFAAPGASAADFEVGDRCGGGFLVADKTLLVKENGEFYGELPPVVPLESEPGAITEWTVRVSPDAPTTRQKLVVYALTANGEGEKLAESEPETISPGVHRFTTDLPVPEFARIGLYGPDGTIACEADGHGALALGGDPAEGDAVPLTGGPEDTGVPVVVTIDGRGGDGDRGSTEGGRRRICPVGGSGSDDCHRAKQRIHTAVRWGAIFLALRTNAPGTARATGNVRWWVPRLAAVPPRARDRAKLRVARLRGGVRRIAPGRATRFRLALPRPLLRRLATLPPRVALSAQVRVRVESGVGFSSVLARTVKLRGRALR